jgi:hypothetical protein
MIERGPVVAVDSLTVSGAATHFLLGQCRIVRKNDAGERSILIDLAVLSERTTRSVDLMAIVLRPLQILLGYKVRQHCPAHELSVRA